MSDHETEKNPQDTKKFWIETTPILVFLALWWLKDIYWATAALMILTIFSVSYLWKTEGKMPLMPVVSLVMILVFGGLTLYMQDPKFIKLRATIFYGFAASALMIGLFFHRVFLQSLMGQAITLTEEKWKKFTINLSIAFVVLAIGNEITRRIEPEWIWGWYAALDSFILMGFVIIQMLILKPEEFQQES